MKECIKCQRNENQVKLLDAVYDKEIVKICEECAMLEDLPIIRKPSSYQLEAIDKPHTVRQRLARMAGVKLNEGTSAISRNVKVEERNKGITLDKLRPPKDYSKIIQNRFELAKKANKPVDLVDNWNWHIQMARRNRKITLSQLSNLIGEPELVLKMLEQGNLTDDASRIISKLEQFFKINLRKSGAEREAERIQEATRAVNMPARILNFDKESMKNITISDLKRMKDDRERAEREDWSTAEKFAWGRKQEKKEGRKEESVLGKDIEILDD